MRAFLEMTALHNENFIWLPAILQQCFFQSYVQFITLIASTAS